MYAYLGSEPTTSTRQIQRSTTGLEWAGRLASVAAFSSGNPNKLVHCTCNYFNGEWKFKGSLKSDIAERVLTAQL